MRYARFCTGLTLAESIKTVEEKEGIPYLVSMDTYAFPLVYKSSVAPCYSIYRLSGHTFVEEAPKRGELLLHLPFDEGYGSTVKDASGNGNHGVIHGATWVEGKLNGALAFDGQDDYVEIPYNKSLNIAYGFTVSAWVKGDTFLDQRTIINGSETRNGPYLLQTLNDGIAEMALDLSLGWIVIQSAIRLTEGQFRHIAATYEYGWDGGSMKMYINGQLQDTSPLNGTPQGIVFSLPEEKLIIGQRQGSCFFDGVIDELLIYRRALSAEEIQQLYMHGKP